MNLRVGTISWISSGGGNSYTVIWNNVLLTLTARRNTYRYTVHVNMLYSERRLQANEGSFIFLLRPIGRECARIN